MPQVAIITIITLFSWVLGGNWSKNSLKLLTMVLINAAVRFIQIPKRNGLFPPSSPSLIPSPAPGLLASSSFHVFSSSPWFCVYSQRWTYQQEPPLHTVAAPILKGGRREPMCVVQWRHVCKLLRADDIGIIRKRSCSYIYIDTQIRTWRRFPHACYFRFSIQNVSFFNLHSG